jgi:hypothetical protein
VADNMTVSTKDWVTRQLANDGTKTPSGCTDLRSVFDLVPQSCSSTGLTLIISDLASSLCYFSTLWTRSTASNTRLPPASGFSARNHRHPVSNNASRPENQISRKRLNMHVPTVAALLASLPLTQLVARVLCTTLQLRMELTLRSFLLFLRKLVSLFHRRWDQSTRRLWYIFSFVRLRFPSRNPEKGDVIRRSIESPPANPPTAVICASRLPRDDSGTPVTTSPGPISTQVHQPTISSDGDSLSYATPEDQSTEHQGVDGHFLEEGRQVSRSPDSAEHRDESGFTHAILPPNREDLTSNSPIAPSLPASRPPSRCSYRQSHHAGYPLPSQHPQRPPSVHSYHPAWHLNGAEAAARGYAPPSTRPSSPARPLRPSSIAVSVTSQMYRAPRPTSVNSGPPFPRGILRPMIEIDRYKRHKMAPIYNISRRHFLPHCHHTIRAVRLCVSQ